MKKNITIIDYGSGNILSAKQSFVRVIKKENIDSKICKVCKKSFTWRKKWRLNWDRVKYCSKKCSKLS